MQSTVCSICGKSAFDEVVVREVAPKEKWWTKFENHEPQKVGAAVAVLAIIAAVVAFSFSRTDPTQTANELPPPPPTTTNPALLSDGTEAPSIADGVLPPSEVVAPGAPREVGSGLSPWESPPDLDFVTGLLLDKDIDYTADIARVGELLDAFPEPLQLVALDPPRLRTFDGSVDATQVQATQPFGVRTIVRESDEAELGELWLIASGGSPDGDDYLAAARQRWDLDLAVDQFSPEVGVRLWKLGGDANVNIWASDLQSDSLVIIQAPTSVAPITLTDVLKAWRDRTA